MKAYKIFRSTSDGLRSINKSPELDIVYKKGEATRGIDDTPLFVFAEINHARSFLRLYTQVRSGDFEIWEVDAGDELIKMNYVPVVGSKFTLGDAKTYWSQYFGMIPYDSYFEFTPADNMYVCDWVIPLEQVEQWSQ